MAWAAVHTKGSYFQSRFQSLVPKHGAKKAISTSHPNTAIRWRCCLRRVHGRYAQYLNARYRRCGHLWQGRFFSCPLSPAHLDVALRYVEMNAVLVSKPEDYRWSGAKRHCSGFAAKEDLLHFDFWKERARVWGWRRWLEADARPHASGSPQPSAAPV